MDDGTAIVVFQVFYDALTGRRTVTSCSPALQEASGGQVRIEHCRATPSLRDLQGWSAGDLPGDKYLVCLRMKNGAGHAVSLDF